VSSLQKTQVNGRRRSTLGPTTLDAQVIEIEPRPPVKLKKLGLYLRTDQMRSLKQLCLDLQIDDYDFSQAEMIRAAIADFLELSLGEQVARLEKNRSSETEVGIGIGAARPGG
jgi:hypothetical protein